MEMGRKALRELARRMVVTERARLESMRRAVRGLGRGEGRNKKAQGSGKGVNGKAVNGKAVEPAPAAGPSAQPDHVRETAHGESNGAAVAPSTSQDLDAATLPPQDKPGVEDLVDGPSDEPEEEDPLLDLAAEAPERLDGTAAPATAAAEEGEGVEDGEAAGEGEDVPFESPLVPFWADVVLLLRSATSRAVLVGVTADLAGALVYIRLGFASALIPLPSALIADL